MMMTMMLGGSAGGLGNRPARAILQAARGAGSRQKSGAEASGETATRLMGKAKRGGGAAAAAGGEAGGEEGRQGNEGEEGEDAGVQSKSGGSGGGEESERDAAASVERENVYWEEAMTKVTKLGAKSLLKIIDRRYPFGTDPSKKGVGEKGLYGKVFPEMRRKYPNKIVLCRVGEFYETMGYDAVLLVEYANLNPMGADPVIARAGCPKQNIHRTLRDLTDAGFSVVVIEEHPKEPGAAAGKP
jgi:hypothetical protein